MSDNEICNIRSKGSCRGNLTRFRIFGNPLISRERLKLETSYLAGRRKAVSYSVKKQNWVKRVTWWSRDLLLEFRDTFKILGPHNISRTVEAINIKFGTVTDGSELKREKWKIGSKAVMSGSWLRKPNWKFTTP